MTDRKKSGCRRVLVTAGPTWTRIDRVRVIGSIFSGETGLRIANHMASKGDRVTVLLGPGGISLAPLAYAGMEISHFVYFSDLERSIVQRLSQTAFDVIIHSAAVSDYRSMDEYPGKIDSELGRWDLALGPTRKLSEQIRHLAPSSFLVTFKLEFDLSESDLIRVSQDSLTRYGSDLVVANDLDHIRGEFHRAFLIPKDGEIVRAETKSELCEKLYQCTL